MSNAGAIATLTNRGTISGGRRRPRRVGGAGVSNAGATIGVLRNGGATIGGAASEPVSGETAGAGVANSGTITTLANSGTIQGGNGGRGFGASQVIGVAGVDNHGTIATLTNNGTIQRRKRRRAGAW